MEDEINSNGIIITKNLVKIGSRKVFLHSGEVHYFRIPPEEWEDRLTKVKGLGLNAISTYIYWNFHEELAGKFDIASNDKDLDHFLHLCENKGFYIIIRPGPWIGSDLVNGGIPQWVLDDHPKIMSLNEKYELTPWKSKENPPISYLSPTYFRIIEKYFQNLSDVLRRHLYPHGGLILLQIDNEIDFSSNLGIFDVGYNPVSLEFYRKFLKEKYRDIESINDVYSQNFLSIDHLEPPTSKTNEDAVNSQNDFKSRGEFLRNLDWMEFRERVLQEYVATISYFLRRKGIYMPFFVNVPFIESPVNIKEYYNSYKTKILVGLDINKEYLHNLESSNKNLESKIEILKSQMPLFCFIPELKIGTPDKRIPPNNVHLLVRQLLGNGVKGFNYYMGVGGISPTLSSSKISKSVLEKSIGFDGGAFIEDDSGNSYDYCAPIGMKGQKNPNYEVVELLSKYIRTNEARLLSAKKVYDDDIVILHYHPYTRMRFDSSKFGFTADFQQVLHDYPYSEFSIFSKLGYHLKYLDLETTSFEQLHRHKIAVIILSSFLDKNSMEKLRRFIEEGGTLISFYDIPINNEKMRQDNTLSSLYEANIQNRENKKSIKFNEKKLTSFHLLHSFNLTEDNTNKTNDYQNVVIACDNSSNSKKIYGFHRPVKKGHIYHFGFIPSEEGSSVQIFKEFLSNLKIAPKMSIHPENLTILRMHADTGEEFITVTNFTNSKFENTDVIFHKVMNGDGEDTVHLKDVTILERSSIQWSVNKKITENAYVKICTSEINEIRKRVKDNLTQYTVEGFHFKGSRNILEVNMNQRPDKVISSKKDITKRIFQPDNKLRVQFKEIDLGKERFYKISVVYSDDLQLSLQFNGNDKKEIVDFNIKKKNNFLDQIA